MNLYNQLKALKEAGFPQEPRISIGGLDGEIRCGFYLVARPGSDEGAVRFMEEGAYETALLATPSHLEIYKDPVIDELIAALGKHFGVLEILTSGKFGCYIPKDCGTNGIADNPKDALIELYLKTREE